MTDETDYDISEAMIRFGGGFVSQLGLLFRQADLANRARLKAAFPDYWRRYAEMARGADARAAGSTAEGR